MRSLPFLAIATLGAVFGCSQRVPVGTVEVIDTSLSITPPAAQATMDAVRAQIGRMERGDILILIPITGDEENGAWGRILRVEAPHTRESYDADMARFRDAAEAHFAAWSAALGAERNRTDIFGSIDVALQEIDSIPSQDRRRIIILSDFLEDDRQYRFVSEPALTDPGRARLLAARIRARHRSTIRAVPLCLGRLESIDVPSLSPERRSAVDAFWAAYLSPLHHGSVIQADPAGMLAGSDEDCLFAQP